VQAGGTKQRFIRRTYTTVEILHRLTIYILRESKQMSPKVAL